MTPPPPPHIWIDFWAESAKGQIQGRAIIGQWGAILHRTLQQQTEYIAIWEEVLIFLAFSFWDILVSCMWLSHFHLLPFKYIYGAKCLIYIHLCTFHVKDNSARLQWYSCTQYKAPGPLVLLVQLWEFLALSVFSSPEPKAQVSFCHSATSVVHPSVLHSSVVVVRKISHF